MGFLFSEYQYHMDRIDDIDVVISYNFDSIVSKRLCCLEVRVRMD